MSRGGGRGGGAEKKEGGGGGKTGGEGVEEGVIIEWRAADRRADRGGNGGNESE